MSKNDIENIVDKTVRENALKMLEEFGDGDPKKIFADPANHPFIEAKKGRKIPIHSARIRKNLETIPLGKGRHTRYVQSERNHHMEVVRTTTSNGSERWEGRVVNMLDAYRRLEKKEPVIKREHADAQFLFSLALGEVIELDGENEQRGLYVVRAISSENSQIRFVPLNDGRKLKDIPKAGHTALPDRLRQRNCRKVLLTPLGEVRYAND